MYVIRQFSITYFNEDTKTVKALFMYFLYKVSSVNIVKVIIIINLSILLLEKLYTDFYLEKFLYLSVYMYVHIDLSACIYM